LWQVRGPTWIEVSRTAHELRQVCLAIVVFAAGRRSRTDLRWFLVNLAAAHIDGTTQQGR